MSPIRVSATGCLTALGDSEATFAAVCAGEARFGAGPAWAPTDAPVAVVTAPIERFSRHRTFALALAALDGVRFDPDGLAIIFATTTSGMVAGEIAIGERIGGEAVAHPEDLLVSQLVHQPATVLAAALGATGPSLSISTACTSGTLAFSVAEDLLRSGRCRRALVVGADALCRTTLFGFRALGAHTRTVCRPFDEHRDGMAIGEAGAFVLLERGEGEITLLGTGCATDAHHLTAPDPEGRGLARAIRLATAGRAVDHVNAHATGTPANDGVEAGVLSAVLPEAWVSATKGATGHTLGAAGVLEAVLLIRSLHAGLVPGTVGCQAPLAVAVSASTRLREQTVGVSVNLAFGGQNAAVAFERHR